MAFKLSISILFGLGLIVPKASSASAPGTGIDRSGAGQVLVTDFGAVGDGLTDDTAAIQKAIDFSSRLGLEVEFPAGTYMVNPARLSAFYPTSSTYAFEMRSNMHLRGNGDAVLKFKDSASTDSSPRRLNMFFSASALSNISFRGLTFDGNWTKNLISPKRGSSIYNVYNQTFIGFWGPSALGDDVLIEDSVFENNAGANNIVSGAVPNGVKNRLGRRWTIRNTTHIDGGMDTNDFTAIFGYAEDMLVEANVFLQTSRPTSNTGPGARTAFEVHGARTKFVSNSVRSYFGGVIVTSNWTNPVSAVEVARNTFSDMFACGVRLWRQSSGGHVQSPISDVRIADNVVQLNSTLYARPRDFKAGIYGASSTMAYSITDVAMTGNSILQAAPPKNISAAVYLQGGTIPRQKHDRFYISRNSASGTYFGIFVQTAAGAAGATWGALTITDNKIRHLASAGIYSSPTAYFFRGADWHQISHLVLRGNFADGRGSATAQKTLGLWLQGAITGLTLANNRFVDISIPLTDLRCARVIRKRSSHGRDC